QVNDDAVVDGAEPRNAVGPTADGQVETVLAAMVDGRNAVVGVTRPDDDSRVPVDHRVEALACLLIPRVAGGEHLAADLLAQLLDGRISHAPLLGLAGAPLPRGFGVGA